MKGTPWHDMILDVRGFLIHEENLEYYYSREYITSKGKTSGDSEKKSIALKDSRELLDLIYSINPASAKLVGPDSIKITCYVIACNADDPKAIEHVCRLHQLIGKTTFTPGTVYDPIILISIGKEPLELGPKINEVLSFSQRLIKENQNAQSIPAAFQEAICDLTNNTANSIQKSLAELQASKNYEHGESKLTCCIKQKLIFVNNKSQMLDQLIELSKKAKELAANNQEAAKEAQELHTILKGLSDDYFYNPNQETYLQFKKQSLEAIKKASPVLSTHRELWKVILGNIILAILGLGVLYGTAVLINKNFFFVETKSKQRLNSIKQILERDDLAQTELDGSIFKI